MNKFTFFELLHKYHKYFKTNFQNNTITVKTVFLNFKMLPFLLKLIIVILYFIFSYNNRFRKYS